MASRYGKRDCGHIWVIRKDGYEEQCAPMICELCGAFGCHCQLVSQCSIGIAYIDRDKLDMMWKYAKTHPLNGNANINGRWINPYVVRDAINFQISEIFDGSK